MITAANSKKMPKINGPGIGTIPKISGVVSATP
jgi:hypothetical protein